MIDSKILLPVVGLLASFYAVNSINNKKDQVKENMTSAWGLPRDVKVNVQVADNAKDAEQGKFTNVQNNYRTMLQSSGKADGFKTPSGFYTVPGTFQSQIAPRMFSGDYGANITYNLPSKDNLAVPTSPLDYAKSIGDQPKFNIQENYGEPVSCQRGGESLSYHGGAPLMQPGYADGNYNKAIQNSYEGKENIKYSHSNLPVGDMTTFKSSGEEDEPIVYDRYLFANLNSRLRSQGDFFRGDLPIVPNNYGWFNPSVQPNLDLNQGALFAMGGSNNETAQELADLVYTTSGNYKTTIAGSNMKGQLGNPADTNYKSNKAFRSSGGSRYMSNNYKSNVSAGGGDVSITAFP